MNNPLALQPYYLPKRGTRNVGGFQNSNPKRFVTNFYDVKLHSNLSKIYVYEARFPPDIPSDSSQIFNKCLYQLRA